MELENAAVSGFQPNSEVRIQKKCTFWMFALPPEQTPQPRAQPSQVLIQPLDVAVPGLHAGREIRGPHGEDHAAVEAVVEVVEGDKHRLGSENY